MSNQQNINPVVKIIFLITFNLVFLTACNSQQGKRINQHKETFKKFCVELKQSKIVYNPDTTNIGLGVYEFFAEKYFAKPEMISKMQVDTSYLTVNAKFFLVQQFIAVLQRYLQKIPEENLKVIAETESKSLNKEWEKYSNKDESGMIKNGLVLVFTDSRKDIQLMSISFSSSKSKIIFLTSLGMSMEDSKFIENMLLKKQ